MFIRRVGGNSMAPRLKSGDVVIGYKRSYAVGDIVVAHQAGREVVKRIAEIKGSHYYLLGDNAEESTDSRHLGPVDESAILGSIMITLPHAVAPPKPEKPYGVWLGRIVALVLILMALVHLYRIDTFIPLLDKALPYGNGFATFAAFVIILSEIFAIPFALRMKLSPLAHIVSGELIVLAPFWWLLIDIWNYGLSIDTAQLGQFWAVYGTWLAIVINLVWLGFSYLTLYMLGFNKLKFSSLLRK